MSKRWQASTFFHNSPLTALPPPTATRLRGDTQGRRLAISTSLKSNNIPSILQWLINMRIFMYLHFQSKITKWCVKAIPIILRFLQQRHFASALRSFWALINGLSAKQTICKDDSYLCTEVNQGLQKATFLSLFSFNTCNLEDVHVCETLPGFAQH